MEWNAKLFGLVLRSLPEFAKVIPNSLKKRAIARLNDYNIFASFGTNDDLLRALRLAWIEVALKIDEEVGKSLISFEWTTESASIRSFSSLLRENLRDLRSLAFERRTPLKLSAIDLHLREIIIKSPIALMGTISDTDTVITKEFRSIVAKLIGCRAEEVPGVYEQIAEQGLPSSDGRTRQNFGELVYVVFTETIQNPKRYPEATNSFGFALQGLGVELGQQCLNSLRGLESRLDQLLDDLDDMPHRGELKQWFDRLDDAWTKRWDVFGSQMENVGMKIDKNSETIEHLQNNIEELLALYKSRSASDDYQLAHTTMFALAELLNPRDLLNLPCAIQELEMAVSAALDLIGKGTTPHYEDRFINNVLANSRNLIEAGNIKGSSRIIDQALADIDIRERNEQEKNQRQKVQLLNASIKHGKMEHDALRVADAIEKIIKLEQSEYQAVNNALLNQVAELCQEGEKRGLNFPLEVAILLASKLTSLHTESNVRREISRWRGKSLALLGERAASTELLLQAAEAFGEEVEMCSGTTLLIERAIAQSNLAAVLLNLGNRESDSGQICQAVLMYEDALHVMTPERVPSEMATAQGNLGAALLALAEREGNPDRFNEAITILQSTLRQFSHMLDPFERAKIQNNLGNALRALGERERNADLLNDSIQAYRTALLERAREVSPLMWATTQNDLANALLALGELINSKDLFHQAVETYRVALTERTRETVPLEWAITQQNLATALWRLGECDDGVLYLEQSVNAYREALQVRTRQRVPLDWASTKNNLGNVLRSLGSRKNNPNLLLQAVRAYEQSLEERSQEKVPLEWAMTQHNLGFALLSLAEYEDDIKNIQKSVQAFRNALTVRTREHWLGAWTRSQTALGHALLALGDCLGNIEVLKSAAIAYREVLPELTSAQGVHVKQCIDEAQNIIDTL